MTDAEGTEIHETPVESAPERAPVDTKRQRRPWYRALAVLDDLEERRFAAITRWLGTLEAQSTPDVAREWLFAPLGKSLKETWAFARTFVRFSLRPATAVTRPTTPRKLLDGPRGYYLACFALAVLLDKAIDFVAPLTRPLSGAPEGTELPGQIAHHAYASSARLAIQLAASLGVLFATAAPFWLFAPADGDTRRVRAARAVDACAYLVGTFLVLVPCLTWGVFALLPYGLGEPLSALEHALDRLVAPIWPVGAAEGCHDRALAPVAGMGGRLAMCSWALPVAFLQTTRLGRALGLGAARFGVSALLAVAAVALLARYYFTFIGFCW